MGESYLLKRGGMGRFMGVGIIRSVGLQGKSSKNKRKNAYRYIFMEILLSANKRELTKMDSPELLYDTLALGLYHRFKDDKCVNCNFPIGGVSERAVDFENYVGLILQKTLGGKVEVTKPTGDGGVDIIHTINNEVYLAQVKCYAPNQKIDYKPIAILHSNIVKLKAKAGYFVTTSDYNDNAIKYERELDTDIRLINGNEFSQYVLGHKTSWLTIPEKRSFLDNVLADIDKLIRELFNFNKKIQR